MTTKDEALALALEALGELRKNPALKYEHTFVDAAITAIKQAQGPAKELVQEPVDVESLVDVAYKAWQDQTTFDLGKVRSGFRAAVVAPKQAK
jgi:hypothetical protein